MIIIYHSQLKLAKQKIHLNTIQRIMNIIEKDQMKIFRI